MKRTFQGVLTVVVGAVLAACGGGGSDDNAKPGSEVARGTVINSQLLAQATTAQINAGTSASGVQALTGAAACNVDVRYVKYATRGPKGEAASASTAVFVPNGPSTAPQCSGSRPVVLYAHGTTFTKSFNMANIARDANNAYANAAGTEASLAMAMYAAQGFIVVAPNYLGYDQSSLDYHPYLNAEAQAIDMIDGLRAAKANLNAESSTKPSSVLLVTGVSQGGYVAMATHRAIQRDYAGEFTVAASAGISGPYNLVQMNDVVVGPGPVNAGAVLFSSMLITGYQQAYGDIYASATDVFRAPYAATIEGLLPSDTPVATLVEQGKLPADPTFTKIFGDGGLMTDAFRAGYTTSKFRQALVSNTLVGLNGSTPISWSPTRPIVMCGGAQDPTVFWSVNGKAAQQILAGGGSTAIAYDLEDRATLPAGSTGDLIYGGFQQAKTAAGTNAQAQYHGTLVTPFCTALARGFFSSVLAAR